MSVRAPAPRARGAPVLRLVRSDGWAAVVAVGALTGLLLGRDLRAAEILAGLLVTVGLAQQVLLLALAHRRRRLGQFSLQLPMALVLPVALGVWYWLQRPGQLVAAVTAVVVLLAVVVLNRSAHESGTPSLLVAHLPGAPAGPPPVTRWHPGRLAAGLLALLALAFVSATLDVPGRYLDLLVLVLAVVLGLAGASERRQRRHQAAVRRALSALAPAWLLPYNGSATFHLGMWSPYLRRTGLPVLVLTTSPLTFERVSARYDLPVVCAPDASSAGLTALLPPSVRAAFYVFNGTNRVFLQIPTVRHVFLQHGDSDKAGSANPNSLAYDTIVVAGQAGIDRFAASGLHVPAERFVVLGRPQTEQIERCTRPIASARPPVVLYAPTWKGKAEATNYSSLLLGPKIVKTLLELGAVVVFRPHPAGRSYRPHVKAIERVRAMLAADAERTGRPHRWGDAAEGPGVAEVANASDAMVADVSGIVTDYLQSLKPFAMVSTREPGDAFRRHVPTSQAAYVIEPDLTGLRATLEAMLGPDPLAPVRAERRAYYLGEGDGQTSAAAFVAWVASLAEPRLSPPRAPVDAGPRRAGSS